MMARQYLVYLIFVIFTLPIISEENKKNTSRPWKKFIQDESIEINYPKVKKISLSDTVDLYYLKANTIPKVYLKIYIEGGYLEEPDPKIGLTKLWGKTVTYSGSEKYTQQILSEKLEEHASRFSFSHDVETAAFNFSALSEFFESDLKVILQVVNQPRFHTEDMQLLKKQEIQAKKKRKENPASLAHIGSSLVYWKSHPRGRISTEKTISEIKRKDLMSWHQKMWANSRISIVIAGDFNLDSVKEILKQNLPTSAREVGEKQGNPLDLSPSLKVHETILDSKKGNIYHIHKEIPQSTIIWMAKAIPHHSKEYFAWKIFDFILGGDSFNSILLQDIRTRHGWAYSVYSSYRTDKYQGNIKISAQSRNKNVPSLIKRLEEILNNPKEFLTQEKLEQAKLSIRNKFVFLYRTHFGLLNNIITLRRHGLSDDYLKTFLANIDNTTLKEVLRVAQKYYRSDQFFKIIVAPAKMELPGQIFPLTIPE